MKKIIITIILFLSILSFNSKVYAYDKVTLNNYNIDINKEDDGYSFRESFTIDKETLPSNINHIEISVVDCDNTLESNMNYNRSKCLCELEIDRDNILDEYYFYYRINNNDLNYHLSYILGTQEDYIEYNNITFNLRDAYERKLESNYIINADDFIIEKDDYYIKGTFTGRISNPHIMIEEEYINENNIDYYSENNKVFFKSLISYSGPFIVAIVVLLINTIIIKSFKSKYRKRIDEFKYLKRRKVLEQFKKRDAYMNVVDRRYILMLILSGLTYLSPILFIIIADPSELEDIEAVIGITSVFACLLIATYSWTFRRNYVLSSNDNILYIIMLLFAGGILNIPAYVIYCVNYYNIVKFYREFACK